MNSYELKGVSKGCLRDIDKRKLKWFNRLDGEVKETADIQENTKIDGLDYRILTIINVKHKPYFRVSNIVCQGSSVVGELGVLWLSFDDLIPVRRTESFVGSSEKIAEYIKTTIISGDMTIYESGIRSFNTDCATYGYANFAYKVEEYPSFLVA